MINFINLVMLIPTSAHFAMSKLKTFSICFGNAIFPLSFGRMFKIISLTMKAVILGILDPDNKIFNFLILHAKQYIYNARCNDHRLSVTAFKKQFKNTCTIGKYIAEKNDKVQE